MSGFGYQIGGARPDIGEGFVDLQCDNTDCEATWVGPVGEDCAYCVPEAAEARRKASQRWLEIGERVRSECMCERCNAARWPLLAEVGL